MEYLENHHHQVEKMGQHNDQEQDGSPKLMKGQTENLSGDG